jgi:UDP:flavonoid glycosyltransferase YjiC (YdhE family)
LDHRRGTRPLIYITLGTVSYGAVDVLRRAIDEAAGHPADILVTVGPHGDPTALGTVPDNVHLERFVPQPRLLPQVDLLIHHGGTGTMLGALIEGIPQLILPQGADHFHNAAAVVRAGAGRALRNDEQLPGSISDAVRALLTAGPERAAAQRISADIRTLPAPADVAVMLADFAGQR